MTDTIGEMKHYTQAAYGDSTSGQNFKDWKALIAGIGQGNGAGPQIWAAVSTPLFNRMRADRFFANIMCAISQKSIQLAGFLAFIDDMDLCVTIQPEEQLMIHEKMQNVVTHWAGLL